MVTVSVASIIPETLVDESRKGPNGEAAIVSLHSSELLQRVFSFGVGCGLYVLLSKCAFPEPDDVLGLENSDSLYEEENMELVSTPSKRTPYVDQNMTGKTQLPSSASKRVRSSTATLNRSPSTSASSYYEDSSLRQSSMDLEASVDADTDDTKKNSTTSIAFSGSDLNSPEARRHWRVAMLLFVSLAVHNFPEGLAVAASTMHSQSLGVTTTIAIALHNIPEGIAISVPCLAARPDAPFLAFGLASLSGLAEPLGAVVALLVLQKDKATQSAIVDMKNVLAFVAGIMIMVAVRELFPEAQRHSKETQGPLIAGTLIGMTVMLVSDWVLEA